MNQSPTPQTVLDHVEGDRDLVAGMARLFLRDWGDAASRLQAAFAASDRDSLHSVAHSLKGSAGSFGATAAVEAAREIEKACRANDLSDAAVHVEALSAALEELASVLRSIERE